MGWIADLLKEIPSAARYKAELEEMETENGILKEKVSTLELENKQLRQKIQRRNDIIQKDKFHNNLPKEQIDILKLLAESVTNEEKIVDAVKRNKEAVRFDLEELKEAGLIEIQLTCGFTFCNLTQDGRRYLKKLGFLT